MISRCPAPLITIIHQLGASCLERKRSHLFGEQMQKKRASGEDFLAQEQCKKGHIHSLSLLFPCCCFPAQVAHLQLPGNTPVSHALHPSQKKKKKIKGNQKRSCRGKIMLTSRERKLLAALPPLPPVLSAFHSTLNLSSALSRAAQTSGWALKTPQTGESSQLRSLPAASAAIPPEQWAPTGCCCHNKPCMCHANLGQLTGTELWVLCSNSKSIFFTLLLIKALKIWP